MIPTYSWPDYHISIYCGDAREIIPELSTYDALVTDPPYGNNYKSGHRNILGEFDGIHGDNDKDMVLEVLRLAWKGLKINRHGYVFGPITPSEALPKEVGGTAELIWDKSTMSAGDLSIPWGSSHENIWFGVKRYTGKSSESAGKLVARLRRGTVLRVNRAGETTRSHPTQKPIELMSQLVEMSTNRYDIVLDPFMGTGSTLIAALLEGRQAIGIEINRTYCEAAALRIEKAVDIVRQLNEIR